MAKDGPRPLARPVLDLIPAGMSLDEVKQRFTPYVDTAAGPDGCWPWTGEPNGGLRRSGANYGGLRLPGTRSCIRAHRLAYLLATQQDPGDLYVLHHCDNPPCCNPKHLFLGTPRRNTQDCISKGRWGLIQKLSDEVAAEVRRQWASGKYTQTELAAEYGIHRGHLSSLLLGKYRDKQAAQAPWQAQGKRMPHQKLTDEQVRELRRRHREDGVGGPALAREFGISPSLTWEILAGRRRRLAG